MFSRGFGYRRYRARRSSLGTYRRRSIRSRSIGNTRAARAQRDSTTVVINRITPLPVPFYYEKDNDLRNSSSAIFVSHWDQLRRSQFFSNYSSMYDQMRLDKIRVKITGTSAPNSANNPYTSPTIILAFDRNGLHPDQFYDPFPIGNSYAFTPKASLISTYSSAQSRQWSSGNSFSMYQVIYPSTMQEKSQFISTQDLIDPQPSREDGLIWDFPYYINDDGSLGQRPELPSSIPTTSTRNPASVWTSPAVPFKPITLLAVRSPLAATATSATAYLFNAEFEYTITFRGMRKPSFDGNDDVSATPLLTIGSADITENGVKTETPPDPYIGFSRFVVNTDVPNGVGPGTISLDPEGGASQTFSLDQLNVVGDDHIIGADSVTVNVQPKIEPETISSIDTYNGLSLTEPSSSLPLSSFTKSTFNNHSLDSSHLLLALVPVIHSSDDTVIGYSFYSLYNATASPITIFFSPATSPYKYGLFYYVDLPLSSLPAQYHNVIPFTGPFGHVFKVSSFFPTILTTVESESITYDFAGSSRGSILFFPSSRFTFVGFPQ